jgi:hypothetical protein
MAVQAAATASETVSAATVNAGSPAAPDAAVRPMSSSTSTPAIAEIPAKSSAKETPPQIMIPAVAPATMPAAPGPSRPEIPAKSSAKLTPASQSYVLPGEEQRSLTPAEARQIYGEPRRSVAPAPAPPDATGEIVDPAPFVGTRQSGPMSAISPTPRSAKTPFLSIATPPSTPIVPVTGSLTIALGDVIRRIESGELRVTGYREGMGAEATLVAVLAALLTRER